MARRGCENRDRFSILTGWRQAVHSLGYRFHLIVRVALILNPICAATTSLSEQIWRLFTRVTQFLALRLQKAPARSRRGRRSLCRSLPSRTSRRSGRKSRGFRRPTLILSLFRHRSRVHLGGLWPGGHISRGVFYWRQKGPFRMSPRVCRNKTKGVQRAGGRRRS
jgi:hypothetical protein